MEAGAATALHGARNGYGLNLEANMISMLLAVVAGILFGRWLGGMEAPQPATQKVRVSDLRRKLQTRR